MIYFLNNLGKRKIIGLAILAVCLIVLPLILLQAQQQQNLKQRAEGIEKLHFELTPSAKALNKGEAFITSIRLNNPTQKDISAIDVIIAYDNEALELISFIPIVESSGLTTVVSDISVLGKIHYVGVNSNPRSRNTSGFFAGKLSFKGKQGVGSVNISDVIITATGETQPLAINPVDNKAGTYTIGEPTPTLSSIPTVADLVSIDPIITKVEEKIPEPTIETIDNLTLVVNTIPPSISAIDIDPKFGQVEVTKYIINAKVKGKSNLQFVKATIQYPRGFLLQETIDLYDDGTHGDVRSGDGDFTNIWDSQGKGIPRKIIVEAKDASGNLSTLSKVVELRQDICREAVAGHNSKNTKRVNIVFIGANYANLELFKTDLVESLDFNGTLGGLFSQEPFRSNRDKFNFWYVDQQANGAESCDILNDSSSSECRSISISSAGSCAISNKKIIGLYRFPFRGFSAGDFALVGTAYYPEFKEKIILHEFGHLFGDLGDEYILDIKPNVWRISANIFEGTEQQCLSQDNPWYSLLGKECKNIYGKSCIKNYKADNDKIECVTGVDKEYCRTEVACFKGALFSENYRSSFNTIMRDQYSIDTKTFRRGYGPVNERELCRKIKEDTGSVGGICNEYGL